jgi:hypothetical protein
MDVDKILGSPDTSPVADRSLSGLSGDASVADRKMPVHLEAETPAEMPVSVPVQFPVEMMQRYAGTIVAKLHNEDAADLSDAEIGRCLANCVGGKRLIQVALACRDAGLLRSPR